MKIITRRLHYCWKLRDLMDTHGMTAATDLLQPLAQRGVTMSAVAVWRLVTQRPTRLSLPVLTALCDIFTCTPDDLIHLPTRPNARPPAPQPGRAGSPRRHAQPSRPPSAR